MTLAGKQDFIDEMKFDGSRRSLDESLERPFSFEKKKISLFTKKKRKMDGRAGSIDCLDIKTTATGVSKKRRPK